MTAPTANGLARRPPGAARGPQPPDRERAELDGQFLARLDAFGGPASVPELNDGIPVRWNLDAAGSLLAAGHLAPAGFDPRYGAPRYAVTESGRAELAEYRRTRGAG